MRGITESEIKQTGKMKELVVRAGKYFSVGVLFIACLPVLLPFLFFLSVFGFTFILPLGCALAGFLYFRKYVGMLYRKLPIPRLSAGCSAWGGRRQRFPPASPTEFIELPTSDLPAIETFEAVDPEFDAIVVSTAQRDAPDDPAISSWSGADSVKETSPDDGTEREEINDVEFAEEDSKREGKDADISVQDGTTITGHEDDGTIFENGTGTEAREIDTAPEDETREERIAEGTSAEDGSKREALDEDISVEDGNEREGIDEDIFGEDESRKEVDEDISAEDESKKEEIYEDTSPEDGNRTEGIVELTPAEDENRSKGIDEDISAEGETRVEVREANPSIESGTGREVKPDDVFVEGWTRREGKDDDGHLEGENGRTVVGEEDVLQDVGRFEEFSQEDEKEEKQGDEVEHPEEEKAEKNAERDDEFHTLPSATNHQRSVETVEDIRRASDFTELEDNGKEDEVQAQPDVTGHPDVVIEEQEGNGRGVNNQALEEETTDQKIEASLPDANLLHPELDEDYQEKKRGSSASPRAIPPEDSYHNASEEETPMKADGVRNLLPHQAHEDDIWTCKDCGWKYPNARPSAKIRRNHKKHCIGHPPPGADPSPEQIGKGETERISSLESNADVPNTLDLQHHPKQVAFGDEAAISSAHSGGNDEESSGVRDSESFRSATNEFPPIASESFRSAPDDFPDDRWSGLTTGESQYNEEQDQLAQAEEELQLSDALNAVKGIVGDRHISTGSLLTDIEKLSGFLGIDLPARSADVPDMEWAKLAIEVMTVVVGTD